MNYEKYILLKEKLSNVKEAEAEQLHIIQILQLVISNPNISKEQILNELGINKSQYYKHLKALREQYNLDIRYLEARKSDKYKIVIR